MPYITRDDGEHFVIPSYRDVLTVSQKSQLKNDILTLSRNYGAYITLQAKGPTQYEVAFSPDPGYLLGESIWHHFNRPMDMIYCEAIPNTTEAILVIVKSGAVYLDGRFPLEGIPEELIIFLTQQNNFEIYIYGDVPISEQPESQKFSFEASSVKSFTILDQPVFPTLPLLKTYQLQLVENVLRAQGIGVFPLKPILYGVIIIVIAFFGYNYFTKEKEEVPVVEQPQVDPFLGFYTKLMSPAPDQEIKHIVKNLSLLNTTPGWNVAAVSYASSSLTVLVRPGSSIKLLSDWAKENEATINIQATGVYVLLSWQEEDRPKPNKIYPLKKIVGTLIDRIFLVYPGNHIQLAETVRNGSFNSVLITINLDGITPMILSMIGEQLKDLPLVLSEMKTNVENGQLVGTITLEGLGS